MTAHILPSIVPSPFGRHFSTETGLFNGADSPYTGLSAASSASAAPYLIHQDRQVSSSSAPGLSTPKPTNHENEEPFFPDLDSTSSARSVSPRLPTEAKRACPPSNTYGRHHAIQNRKIAQSSSPQSSHASRHLQSLTELHNGKIETAAGLSTKTPQRPCSSNRAGCPSTRQSLTPVGQHALPDVASGEEKEPLSVSGDMLEGSMELCADIAMPEETSHLAGSSRRHKAHRKRLSQASSAFVHTMKTASVSNASFSIVPRSLRFGRSTDSYGLFGSHIRHSNDSERPGTSASVDEAAFRRGMKRRQILAELMATEESYILDLKALIYLYSTLLASTTTISNKIRSSILRNVQDLLHTHEKLLECLHQAAYEAAARKWADTTSPRHLGSPRRHRRWRSMESYAPFQPGRGHRHTRSSLDSSEVSRGRTHLGCADPRDVSDIAAIFRDFLNDFFVYEEYCANHGLIAHELQRHAPTLWSTYESGIESLSRSLVALEYRHKHDKKGLTVGDLLIKPIQRVTKYPLLFEDLLKHTPVADCPITHIEVEETLKCLKALVQSVNKATDNQETREQVHRRWALQSKLAYGKVLMGPEHFRFLGNIQLCGVLYVTWQTKSRVDGCYALCVLFDNSLMIALPASTSPTFEVVAVLHLSVLTVCSASDGRGLQCHSALHTWKICCEVNSHLHEFIFSACSAPEEQAWKEGMQSKDPLGRKTKEHLSEVPSSVGLDLRSVGLVYGQQSSALSRQLSVQRAATVGNRANICQVMIRNTHNPQDLHDFRQPTPTTAINRSQSHMSSNRLIVLSPKRSVRARLETTLSDVWTKDRLPYPGMSGSLGGQIIRASAGSLVRKLSLASIHAPFSRRSGSISLASRKSYEAFTEGRRSRSKQSVPIFEVRKDSLDDATPARKKSHELPELDTMESVVSRMIGSGAKKISFSHGEGSLLSKSSKHMRSIQHSTPEVGPEDPADMFYSDDKERRGKYETVEEGLSSKKKRWSNPFGILKGLSAEGFRNMLYSTK
ncbi:hypothetical protein PV08_10565 [Exophiala spinifera]|uniref:DH domain-containing protein n=1 Tax=Exophiala spinifera TaxID=91928 RepID=A0A0D2AXU1_9EURO|nr:uncharacterized protein PV08_10565 [Exophiala spinifera]KIW11265.1 hypothetical protein PV08_10565 [Exophiala spinifera]